MSYPGPAETVSPPSSTRQSLKNCSTDATQGGNRPRNAITCPRCDAWWTGLTAGHCSGCHRTFTSVAAFDRHRSGSHAAGTRYCLDPATVVSEKTGESALVPANKPWPGWSLPGTWEGPDQ